MLTVIKAEKDKSLLPRGKKGALVLTRKGVFGADEVFAVALIRLYYSDLNILRTSDKIWVQWAMNNPKTFVVNQGWRFDPQLRNFDARLYPLNQSAMLFSSLLAYLFEDYRTDSFIRRLRKALNDITSSLAQHGAKHKHAYPLRELIAAFNRNDEARQDLQFIKAVNFAYRFIANQLHAISKPEGLRSPAIGKSYNRLLSHFSPELYATPTLRQQNHSAYKQPMYRSYGAGRGEVLTLSAAPIKPCAVLHTQRFVTGRPVFGAKFATKRITSSSPDIFPTIY